MPQPREVGFVRGTDGQDAVLKLTPATVKASADGQVEPVSGRRFSFVAYSGAAMTPMGWYERVIVDLTGVEVPSQTLPALVDHMPYTECVLGQTDKVTVGPNGITAEGDVLAVGEQAVEHLRLADLGFKFQSSIGLKITSREYVDAGASAVVNGKTFDGPGMIVRKGVLREISSTVIGADGSTSFTVQPPVAPVAPAPVPVPEDATVSNSSAGRGGPDLLVTLAATGSGARPILEKPVNENVNATGTPAPTVPAVPAAPPAAWLAEVQASAAAAAAAAIAHTNQVHDLTRNHPEIRAKALNEKWPLHQVELEVLRTERGSVQASFGGFGTGRPGNRVTPQTLTASLCLSAGVRPELIEAEFGKDVLNEAHSKDLRAHASFSALFNLVLQASGRTDLVRFGTLTDDTIRAAFRADRDIQAAGTSASTYSITGVLSNVAGKSLLNSFLTVDMGFMKVFAKGSANDFKQVSKYRITATGLFEKVGADGNIKHATLSEETMTNQVDTYARYMAYTRKDFINDDLGVFQRVAQMLGRNAAVTLIREGTKKWIAPANNFYHANNKNLLTGAGSVFSISAVTAALQTFREQKDTAGEMILARPAYLVVPPALEVPSKQVYRDTTVNETTTTDKPKPTSNPHAGSFEPVVGAYLGTAGVAGGSDTKWWLAADPLDIAAVEVLYLRGQESPVIETGELDMDKLGMAVRGYIDFGFGAQEFRAAVQNNGA